MRNSAHWQANGQVDFAFNPDGGPRLRASAFSRSGISLALRLLPESCPRIEALRVLRR